MVAVGGVALEVDDAGVVLHAATNHHEYFAEGVQSWFDNNRQDDHDPTPHTNTHGKPPRPRRKRYAWAELLRRVFCIDVLLCDACGGRRRLLAFITDVGSIHRILTHLGLPSLPPPCMPARPPPMQPLPFA